MKILINGSSVSAGFVEWQLTDPATKQIQPFQPTWPARLEEKINCDMVNLAVAGAGNTYIHDSTIDELSQRSYDLVLIMWSDYQRLDYRVRNPENFNARKLRYTSMAQSNTARLPPELASKFQHICQDWIFSCDYDNGSTEPILADLFGYATYTNPRLQLHNSLLKIISLQSVLKSLGIPYRFMFYRPFPELNEFKKLSSLIDWDKFMPEPYLYSHAHSIGEWDEPSLHPTPAAYDSYADLVVKYLKDQKLIQQV